MGMAVSIHQWLAHLTAPKASSGPGSSLPGCFDPVVAGLHDAANALLKWCNMTSSWTERLLHDLVILADAHGCFSDLLLSMKQLLVEAQAAVRHRDVVRLAAALHTCRRSDRGLSGLASSLHGLSHPSSSSTSVLAEAVTVAMCVAAAASSAIFLGLASTSTSSALPVLTSPTVASPVMAMKWLRSLEECVVAAEDGCEQVHRALVNTMGSLLDILTSFCLTP
uniref:Uncharacterized protein n=1 Tax=Avena sativa TaxID=4498 RepID=A0ACD6ADB9_AVESA